LLHRTLPWDHAPGVLIVSEAGGYVRKPDGGVWHPSELESGLLAASDEASWHLLHDALLGSHLAIEPGRILI
ncbi:MAG TPA: inositol monophosphatase family protein, partial [Acidiphilium sp.]